MAVIKERQNKGRNDSTKNITINYPEIYDEKIRDLIELGIVSSRSEAVRTAVREYLNREFKALHILGFQIIHKSIEVPDNV